MYCDYTGKLPIFLGDLWCLILVGSDSATNSQVAQLKIRVCVCVYTYTYCDTMLMSWSIQKCIVPSCDFQKIRKFPPHTHSGEDHQFTMSKRNRRHGVGYQTTERVFQTQEHRVSFQLQLSCLDHLHTFAGQVCQPQESLYLFL